jgi:hypothetical protein
MRWPFVSDPFDKDAKKISASCKKRAKNATYRENRIIFFETETSSTNITRKYEPTETKPGHDKKGYGRCKGNTIPKLDVYPDSRQGAISFQGTLRVESKPVLSRLR